MLYCYQRVIEKMREYSCNWPQKPLSDRRVLVRNSTYRARSPISKFNLAFLTLLGRLAPASRGIVRRARPVPPRSAAHPSSTFPNLPRLPKRQLRTMLLRPSNHTLRPSPRRRLFLHVNGPFLPPTFIVSITLSPTMNRLNNILLLIPNVRQGGGIPREDNQPRRTAIADGSDTVAVLRRRRASLLLLTFRSALDDCIRSE